MRLGILNRFAVHPRYLYIAVIVTFVSLIHTFLRWLQTGLYGTRPSRAPIEEAPIFIIGHWRTGTTLLHELLILDPRHSYPNTYQCLEPNHFLLTEGVARRFFNFLMPSRRPMDNMKAGWDRPQEDEFALCMMGQPSPYLTIAFPNRPPMDQDAYDIEQLPRRKREGWKRAFLRYLRQLTWKDPRRLVLKSPTHTFRIQTLLELFPKARFVHIVRNPYVVFPSTVNLWKTLYQTHGLQVPSFEGLEDLVLRTFSRMYEKLEADRDLVPSGQFYELKYEDLVADPIEEMEKVYQELQLNGFEEARPALEQYFQENAGYRTNRYRSLSDHQRALIEHHWKAVIERYGYSEPQPEGNG